MEEPAQMASISMAKVRDGAKKDRITMVIEDTAYDFTDFAPNHPGGAEYLKKNAGQRGRRPAACSGLASDVTPSAAALTPAAHSSAASLSLPPDHAPAGMVATKEFVASHPVDIYVHRPGTAAVVGRNIARRRRTRVSPPSV